MKTARDAAAGSARARLRLRVRGAVQGVGFRPFVYRLANELGLSGWVQNSAQGVTIEIEGSPAELETFCTRLRTDGPPHSSIHGVNARSQPAANTTGFEIRRSDSGEAPGALMLPDLATCPACLREMWNPTNRRYRYPFINCTHCGPRFSIIEALPYDRANTSMHHFTMCRACRREYEDPTNRRFHAQPNACPRCGPQLAFWNPAGATLATKDAALVAAARAIRDGAIVAVKGLGGFHLLVDARNPRAVRRLRWRKHREEKPFAVMFPSLTATLEFCEATPLEEKLLTSVEAPIVLLRRRGGRGIAKAVAPGNPHLGVLLPYTPLHHLLLGELGSPVVATSGNRSDEPICFDEQEAQQCLPAIADFFLVHDRPIVRPIDDSVMRVMAGREIMLRRARGFAPLPVQLANTIPPTLALGGQLKNTFALASGNDAFVSQHIGDLGTPGAVKVLRQAVGDLQRIYRLRPRKIVTDEHPDYTVSRLASEFEAPIVTLQHHCAHILSCMAEHHLTPPVLGIAWDGSGYGSDGTIWGGEFLRITENGFARLGHLRTFRLPGGEKAAREPRRSAVGVLHEIFGEALFQQRGMAPFDAFTGEEKGPLKQMLSSDLNSPLTSSAGRLFDAVASLLGLRHVATFEGQAAMELEFAVGDPASDEGYEMPLRPDGVIDWEPALRAVLIDLRCKRSAGEISAKFHNGLVEAMIAVAHRAGESRVVLSGGCFQNQYLTERAIRRLREEEFTPCWHRRVPPNDGGIALGQIFAASGALADRANLPQ